jgi:hypothetical protein
MSHLSLLTSVLALSLLAGGATANAASLPAETSHSSLATLARSGGFGGGRGFGGDAGFARGGDGRAITDDAYRGGRYWGGAGYIGGGTLGEGYCGSYAQSDWPRGSCNQF